MSAGVVILEMLQHRNFVLLWGGGCGLDYCCGEGEVEKLRIGESS